MDTSDFRSWAPTLSFVVALVAFVFAVISGWWRGRQETSRREWERLQQLAVALANLDEKGAWAQKLAARELGQFRTKKTEALLLTREALSYWENPANPCSQALLTTLQDTERKLSGRDG